MHGHFNKDSWPSLMTSSLLQAGGGIIIVDIADEQRDTLGCGIEGAVNHHDAVVLSMQMRGD